MVFKASNFCNFLTQKFLTQNLTSKRTSKNLQFERNGTDLGLNLISPINKTCFLDHSVKLGIGGLLVDVHEFRLCEKNLKILFYSWPFILFMTSIQHLARQHDSDSIQKRDFQSFSWKYFHLSHFQGKPDRSGRTNRSNLNGKRRHENRYFV